MWKPIHFPYDEVYHRTGIRWEKSAHTMGKVWVPISQFLQIQWILLYFPVLWEINEETHAFTISLSIPKDGNWMEKKHPYYGKSMSTNFPGSPHTMGFVAFSVLSEIDAKPNYGKPCVSHMMRFINFFLWIIIIIIINLFKVDQLHIHI